MSDEVARPGMGSMMMSLAEPTPGFEIAYNRWYEDDHLHAAGTSAPWIFAAQRWVATKALRDMRRYSTPAVIDPPGDGCYLVTLWNSPGHAGDYRRWVIKALAQLRQDGRAFDQRKLVLNAHVGHVGTVYRDKQQPADVHALDCGYAGLVLEIIDAVESDALLPWLIDSHVPARLHQSAAAQCVIFRGEPLETKQDPTRIFPTASDSRFYLLWFLDVDPAQCLDELFRDEESALRNANASLTLLAPFLRTHCGSNDYVDQLR